MGGPQEPRRPPAASQQVNRDFTASLPLEGNSVNLRKLEPDLLHLSSDEPKALAAILTADLSRGPSQAVSRPDPQKL